MRTMRTLLTATLIFTLVITPSAFAQERHAVNPSVLAQTVTDQVAQQDADRATIHEALNRPEVREIAAKSGFDLERMQASINTLSGNQLSQAATAAQEVNQSLVGGASVIVVSTTTVIIVLLIVLVIVAAD